jgi:uncharacterized integral membrane protein
VKWAKTLLIMILFILAILFSLQNKDEVSLRFSLFPIKDYYWELPKLPLFLIILCSVFLGVLIGGISNFYQRYQLKKALRQNEKMIERLSREVETLRSSGMDQPSFLKKDV